MHTINHKNIFGYSGNLLPYHPGYYDIKYKQRRIEISNLANNYVLNNPIPKIKYTETENRVWNSLITNLKDLYPKYACNQFNKGLKYMMYNNNYIPQLEDISNLLYDTNAWKIRPVSGLLHPKDFLGGLYYKYLHSTQYVRHHVNPGYISDSDVIHELLGHIPMILIPEYSNFIKIFGKISLDLNEKEIWKLIKLYWYIIEFGLIREGKEKKAFGAGILSNIGEMNNFQYDNTKIIPFNSILVDKKIPKINYNNGYQEFYYIIEDFTDAINILKEFYKLL